MFSSSEKLRRSWVRSAPARRRRRRPGTPTRGARHRSRRRAGRGLLGEDRIGDRHVLADPGVGRPPGRWPARVGWGSRPGHRRPRPPATHATPWRSAFGQRLGPGQPAEVLQRTAGVAVPVEAERGRWRRGGRRRGRCRGRAGGAGPPTGGWRAARPPGRGRRARRPAPARPPPPTHPARHRTRIGWQCRPVLRTGWRTASRRRPDHIVAGGGSGHDFHRPGAWITHGRSSSSATGKGKSRTTLRKGV